MLAEENVDLADKMVHIKKLLMKFEIYLSLISKILCFFTAVSEICVIDEY